MTIYTILQDDLDKYLAMWNESSIVDYDYTVRISCFCVPAATAPKFVQVADNQIMSITDIESGTVEEEFSYPTVLEMFQNVQRSIDDKIFIIDVTYNETMGYISYYYFDVHPGLADEEVATTISDLVASGGQTGGAEAVDDGAMTTSSPTSSPTVITSIVTGPDDGGMGLSPTMSPTVIANNVTGEDDGAVTALSPTPSPTVNTSIDNSTEQAETEEPSSESSSSLVTEAPTPFSSASHYQPHHGVLSVLFLIAMGIF
jgi:hypothetical protein